MRILDQRECECFGMTPYEALASSRERSELSQEIWKDGMLLAEWGWRTDSFLTRSASAWMLSFPPIESRRVFAARESLRLLEMLLCHYEVIHCEVMGSYKLSVRWLTWLGFVPESCRRVDKELFIVMKIERNQWAR